MKVTNNYNLFEFESKSEIENYLRVNQFNLLNNNCVDQKIFYGIGTDTVDSIFIGVVGGQHGIIPSLQEVETENCILISIDEKVYCVELKNYEMLWLKEFDSIVYEILKAPDFSLLILCELGVTCITYSGEKLWEHTSDVITDYRLEGNSLRLSTDEEEYYILLKNGSVI
ncbi:hypothetical protein PVA17_12110 [Lysinibacillus sp. CNPSo 3705]|uniref:hypothetical protein n=1 Tax=Lysinibacillus sp. CNPSo 3705 TaxID=3028148 RepID=UPI00236499FA|nr:hypothetical protein [Lysinibacillus sp. CNPSo 3705]MDD1503501.1 hypothetical protein [Lysinibacillus sp. CNPSo 3705]